MNSLLNSRKFRRASIQAAFLLTLGAVLVAALVEGRANIAAQGMTTGFTLIPYTSCSPCARLILVGLVNTPFLGIIGIVLANVPGLVAACLRMARNATFNLIGTIYIETIRDIPILLQAVFWYALISSLPGPKQACQGFGSFLSSRGLYLPGLNVTGVRATLAGLALFAGLVAVLVFSLARRFSRVPVVQRSRVRRVIRGAALALAAVAMALGRLPDLALASFPELRGLNIRDGIRVTPEFTALVTAMALYGGAYIAEIIRAGFPSVGKGQVEAAQSLGLSPWHVFSRVRLPLAIRAVLPTPINQYVGIFKATTLGIAVGCTDFFAVISVSINQAGQTLELIGILMLGFLVINNSIAIVLNRVNKAIALKGSQLRA